MSARKLSTLSVIYENEVLSVVPVCFPRLYIERAKIENTINDVSRCFAFPHPTKNIAMTIGVQISIEPKSG